MVEEVLVVSRFGAAGGQYPLRDETSWRMGSQRTEVGGSLKAVAERVESRAHSLLCPHPPEADSPKHMSPLLTEAPSAVALRLIHCFHFSDLMILL